jgi:hypothetical protein
MGSPLQLFCYNSLLLYANVLNDLILNDTKMRVSIVVFPLVLLNCLISNSNLPTFINYA